mmetsp:Transcript_5882/g.18094  ORF Transcript_5882/g.18094 Transcript_5882/m.18094 type:complete len:186 (-) Transcript_5882:813-1370(-)
MWAASTPWASPTIDAVRRRFLRACASDSSHALGYKLPLSNFAHAPLFPASDRCACWPRPTHIVRAVTFASSWTCMHIRQQWVDSFMLMHQTPLVTWSKWLRSLVRLGITLASSASTAPSFAPTHLKLGPEGVRWEGCSRLFIATPSRLVLYTSSHEESAACMRPCELISACDIRVARAHGCAFEN